MGFRPAVTGCDKEQGRARHAQSCNRHIHIQCYDRRNELVGILTQDGEQRLLDDPLFLGNI
eukprot:7892443-Prorocentrum_lima.AAC.1